MKQVRLGILRENKLPADSRAPLTPRDCKKILSKFSNLEIYIQPSKHRCFSAQEYSGRGVHVREELSNCDILMGVKEVPVSNLMSGKTYLFFSHTIKEQPHNKELLRQILFKDIELIDYECLIEDGKRLVGFGHYAGIAGAHNSLWAWGQRTNDYTLKRAFECKNYTELKEVYNNFNPPPLKIVLTGSGRVASGVLELMEVAGIKKVSPSDFLSKEFKKPVFTQLDMPDLYEHKEGKEFDWQHFFDHPEEYKSKCYPYTKKADMLINAFFWQQQLDRLFTVEQMREDDFNIKVIGDISCDIDGSIPATLKTGTIKKPVYGFDPQKKTITEPFKDHVIDVMAVDNLPNELARDASKVFSSQLLEKIMPLLLREKDHPIIQRATITKNGELTERYRYLESFVGADMVNR